MTDHRLRLIAGDQDAGVDNVFRRLSHPTIQIIASQSLIGWRHQVLLLALVDLLGRVFPRLDVAAELDIAASAALPPGPTNLRDRLLDVRARSPLTPLPAQEPTVIIHIGPGTTMARLYVDGAGWQTYLGTVPSRLTPALQDCAIGPVLAACRAGARVFDMLVTGTIAELPAETYCSALTYTDSSDPIDEPETGPLQLDALLAGAGSVGGAAVYTFAFEPSLSGSLIVCDPQSLEERNPFRAILATANAAAAELAKATVAERALVHQQNLAVTAHATTIAGWEESQPAPLPLALVLVAVDSVEAREEIQDSLPLDLVNAAVAPDLAAISGHRTGQGPCVWCLHLPDVLDENTVKNKLIAASTGMEPAIVNVLRVRQTPLAIDVLEEIERRTGRARGAFARYEGKTLDELYAEQLLYGESEIPTDTGVVAVASPFVTTLAGALLAAEAYKRSTPHLHEYALGTGQVGVRRWENPAAPSAAQIDADAPRHPLCLCRNTRRLRLTAARYDLQFELLVD